MGLQVDPEKAIALGTTAMSHAWINSAYWKRQLAYDEAIICFQMSSKAFKWGCFLDKLTSVREQKNKYRIAKRKLIVEIQSTKLWQSPLEKKWSRGKLTVGCSYSICNWFQLICRANRRGTPCSRAILEVSLQHLYDMVQRSTLEAVHGTA